jgi:uncharacterized protein (TIGR02996 family)
MRAWAWNTDLEEAIREDPDDDGRWSVYEDWILEQEDERAAWIRAQKAGDEEASLKARWALGADLLGSKTLSTAIAGGEWRACFVDRIVVSVIRGHVIDQLLAARATSLARAMRITIDYAADLARLLSQLASATCRRTLRRLAISAYWRPPTQEVTFDTAALAVLDLDELQLQDRAITVPYGPAFAKLRRLEVVPGRLADLEQLFDGVFPVLRRLDLDLHTLEARQFDPVPAMARLLAGSVAPQLETLDVLCTDAVLARLHKALQKSALGKTLRVLEHQRVPTAWSPA